MNLKRAFIVLIVLVSLPEYGLSQQSNTIKKKIEEHYDQALRYKELTLFGESNGELDLAIKLANKYNYQEEMIRATIAKGEILRKTENFDRGIILLQALKNTEKYPKLHVQKLGRLAALYAENARFPKDVARDSVESLTDRALEMAVQLNLKEEEAGLRNEIGFAQNRARKFRIALKNLEKSADLYSQIGDQQNELGVQTNILDLYTSMRNFPKCDSLYPILVERIKDRPWYSAKSKLYKIISMRYYDDTVLHLQWVDKANGATVSLVRLINSNQMASFKVIHDTDQFKDEALQKSNALALEKGQTQRLLLFSSILILVIVIVILVFFREKKMKWKLDATVGDLNVMNDKYEMLIIESNHRIKNNLQMIISMLEFTKKGMQNSDTDIIQSMSGKIQTISALHKHLYVDIHNEHVDLSTYFDEILRHYKEIGLKYTVNKSVCSAQIRSERIVYFGLILNEMLSNTLEHGASDQLQVTLNVTAHNGGFLFFYSDGSPHENNLKEGTGTKLIKQLVGRIKGTDYQMLPENGTYQFTFETDKID